MGVLFAEWTDKEVGGILLAFGTFFTALSYIYVRVTRTRTSNTIQIREVELKETVQQDAVEDDRYDKWLKETRNLLRQQDQRIAFLEKQLSKKEVDEAKCQRDLATLTEKEKWMKRILKEKGWISDHDEDSYPRTKSDEIQKPGGRTDVGG